MSLENKSSGVFWFSYKILLLVYCPLDFLVVGVLCRYYTTVLAWMLEISVATYI